MFFIHEALSAFGGLGAELGNYSGKYIDCTHESWGLFHSQAYVKRNRNAEKFWYLVSRSKFYESFIWKAVKGLTVLDHKSVRVIKYLIDRDTVGNFNFLCTPPSQSYIPRHGSQIALTLYLFF